MRLKAWLLFFGSVWAFSGYASEAELQKMIALQQAKIAELEARIGPTVAFTPDMENLDVTGRDLTAFWTGSYKKIDDVVFLRMLYIFSKAPAGKTPLKIKLPEAFPYRLKPGRYLAGISRYIRNNEKSVSDAFRIFFYIAEDGSITWGWSDKPTSPALPENVGTEDARVHEINIDVQIPILR